MKNDRRSPYGFKSVLGRVQFTMGIDLGQVSLPKMDKTSPITGPEPSRLVDSNCTYFILNSLIIITVNISK